MKLTFMGAAKTVTGSKYLLTIDNKNILIDCGLFQGYKELRLRNWEKLPVDPHSIDSVVLTHAHIDHSGYLPLLVKNGFSKKIYCSAGTRDLCSILLPDSAYLQEEEANFANRHGYSKHAPALPLYTVEDATKALLHFNPIDFGIEYQLLDDISVKLQRAGHIIGASFILLKCQNTTIAFSGDIGRFNDPVMKTPSTIQEADYLLLESTYGDRTHDKSDPTEKLGRIINETIKRGGTIIIPAFAVGRTQTILYHLHQLRQKNIIPHLPIYLDSPMAISATEILHAHASDHRLSRGLANEICEMPTYVNTQEESKALTDNDLPKIIITASGMATGGRVLHHLARFAPHAKNTLIFTGFQAPATRGDIIVKGQKQVKMLGQMIPINASVFSFDNMSAHADNEEILTWLEGFQKPPKKIFITHGEPASSAALASKIKTKFGWECVVPEHMQIENLF